MEINIKSNYNFDIINNDDELIVKIKKINIESFNIKNNGIEEKDSKN